MYIYIYTLYYVIYNIYIYIYIIENHEAHEALGCEHKLRVHAAIGTGTGLLVSFSFRAMRKKIILVRRVRRVRVKVRRWIRRKRKRNPVSLLPNSTSASTAQVVDSWPLARPRPPTPPKPRRQREVATVAEHQQHQQQPAEQNPQDAIVRCSAFFQRSSWNQPVKRSSLAHCRQ